MGNFSWCTSDTKKSIACRYDSYAGAPKTVYLLNPFGEPYKESDYEGYGEFGGCDVYELVAEWNRPFLSEANLRKPQRSNYAADKEGTTFYKRAMELFHKTCKAVKAYVAGASDEYMREHYGAVLGFGDGSDWKRCLGIAIACYDEQQVKLRYPIKIVEEPCAYEEASISPSCPFQGCFYDENYKEMQFEIDKCFDKLSDAAKAFADEKADALDLYFTKSKMDDMYVAETYPQLIVRDDEGNSWIDGEIYDFVLNECLAWEPDGSLQFGFGAIFQELADTLKNHALYYGVFPEQVQKSIDAKILEATTIKEEPSQNNIKTQKHER